MVPERINELKTDFAPLSGIYCGGTMSLVTGILELSLAAWLIELKLLSSRLISMLVQPEYLKKSSISRADE